MAMFRNSSGTPFPVGTNPVSNATADVNGDGFIDILTSNSVSYTHLTLPTNREV